MKGVVIFLPIPDHPGPVGEVSMLGLTVIFPSETTNQRSSSVTSLIPPRTRRGCTEHHVYHSFGDRWHPRLP